ncbi:MAG: hypothetical protein IE916_00515 [Epsilonproteobacteria bacterium]|nr:hypothetical protein [Campylobacterota bacterium]
MAAQALDKNGQRIIVGDNIKNHDQNGKTFHVDSTMYAVLVGLFNTNRTKQHSHLEII